MARSVEPRQRAEVRFAADVGAVRAGGFGAERDAPAFAPEGFASTPLTVDVFAAFERGARLGPSSIGGSGRPSIAAITRSAKAATSSASPYAVPPGPAPTSCS